MVLHHTLFLSSDTKMLVKCSSKRDGHTQENVHKAKWSLRSSLVSLRKLLSSEYHHLQNALKTTIFHLNFSLSHFVCIYMWWTHMWFIRVCPSSIKCSMLFSFTACITSLAKQIYQDASLYFKNGGHNSKGPHFSVLWKSWEYAW